MKSELCGGAQPALKGEREVVLLLLVVSFWGLQGKNITFSL